MTTALPITAADFKMAPAEHQVRGARALVANRSYGLFWEMRLRKTATVVTAASRLLQEGRVDQVVVVSPAQVKDVWRDPELGDIEVHALDGCKKVFDYEARTEEYLGLGTNPKWVTASLEFLRQEDAQGKFPKVERLLEHLEGDWILVVDEGAAIGNYKSLQWKACFKLRLKASGCWLLDGTPIGNSPMEQYSKFKMLDPFELWFKYRNFWHFRASHAVVKKSAFSKRGAVTGFKRQDAIDKMVKGHCEYLERGDVKDLDFREPTESFFTVPLSKATWKVYCQLRDEMVAELETGDSMAVNHAATKALRLLQCCGGFLGGFDGLSGSVVKELSDEKSEAFMKWLVKRMNEKPSFKCVLWCRFRPELERMVKRLDDARMECGFLYGGQSQSDDMLHPNTKALADQPFVLVAQPQAAKFGLNFSRADAAVYLSCDYDRVTRLQSRDRIVAPGQTGLVVDVLATGPNGERTADWDVLKAWKSKEDVARRTAGAWKRALVGI